jgi:hypothetical protein
MSTDTFYAATSALCFTLLGFWWVVVQFRHVELTHAAGPRRFAFLVSLYFVLPGLVSLASLLAGGGVLWRVAFGLAGVVGIAAVVVGTREVAATSGTMGALARWSWVGVPLYALLAVFAAFPEIARKGLGLEPLQVEGYVLVLILLLGIVFAWLLFTDPLTHTSVPGDDGG